MTKVSPELVSGLPRIFINDDELTSLEVSFLTRLGPQEGTHKNTSQSTNEIISTTIFCQYDPEASNTSDACLHITCKYKLQVAKQADSSKKRLEIIDAFDSTSSLENEMVFHEEMYQ